MVTIAGFIISFLFNFNFSRFCLGGIVPVFIEWSRVEVPNSPVSNGNKGCVVFEFNAATPRKPEITNIRIAAGLFLLSVIRKIEIQIRIQDIILSTSGNTF